MFVPPPGKPDPQLGQESQQWPTWLDTGRVWLIWKLASAGCLMLGLAVIFVLTFDMEIAVYPFIGCLIPFSILALFIWKWKREAKTAATKEVAVYPRRHRAGHVR
jgi:hypothetical protein